MTPEQALAELDGVLAHLWMVRTFLKHADEVQDDEAMLDVPRTLFDSIRATEPAAQRGDVKEYLRRLRGKLPKLRRVADYFAAEHGRVSDHTNFKMASLSLTAAVRRIEVILAAVNAPPAPTSCSEETEDPTPE
jgi:hypothetical protein